MLFTHKGERVIIGGFSPAVLMLPQEFLKTGPVIGINKFAAVRQCDYWLGLDTGLNWQKWFLDDDPQYASEPKFLRTLQCPRFMREPNPDTEYFAPYHGNNPKESGIYFFSRKPAQYQPESWDGSLRWISSSAMAAISLAIVMGAKEIVLYGVDFVGGQRADGSAYSSDNFWDPHKDGINNLMQEFQRHASVYKTHPESWLSCPYMDITEDRPVLQKALDAIFPTPPPPVDSELEDAWHEPDAAPVADELAASEADKYRRIWELDDYRKNSPGLRNLPKFYANCGLTPGDLIGDYGAGSGRAALALRENGYRVRMVDFAENCLNPEVREALLPGWLDFQVACLWQLPADPEPVDVFFCCDVLEHIPEERVDDVLDALAANSKRGGFLAISTVPDGYGARIGETLHVTQRPVEWWRPKIEARWRIHWEEVTALDLKVAVKPLEA